MVGTQTQDQPLITFSGLSISGKPVQFDSITDSRFLNSRPSLFCLFQDFTAYEDQDIEECSYDFSPMFLIHPGHRFYSRFEQCDGVIIDQYFPQSYANVNPQIVKFIEDICYLSDRSWSLDKVVFRKTSQEVIDRIKSVETLKPDLIQGEFRCQTGYLKIIRFGIVTRFDPPDTGEEPG